MKTLPPFLVGGLLLVLCLPARGDDWPQWRGPNRDDVSKEKGLLRTWPAEGPKLLWTYAEAGIGYSGPAVVGDHLYTLGGDGTTTSVYALDVRNPRRVWSTEIGAFFHNGNGDGPRATPTVDGNILFVLTGSGDLACVETATGRKRWQLNMARDLGGQMASGWGYTESPLVDGDRLVCTPGGKDGALAALDKKTGKVLWRSKQYTAPAVYSSIVPAEVYGVREYIQLTGHGVVGVAADDGRLMWSNDQNGHGISVTTPVFHDNSVYLTTSYGVGCGLVRVTGNASEQKAEKAYDAQARRVMFNHHGGVVRVGAYLYGYSDGKGWVCQDFKTGREVWSSNQLGKGSLTYAEGRLYCYTEGDGTVCLVDASPDGWKERGRFRIPRQSQLNRQGLIWTHPVVANGRLYLRDQDLLFCYDVKDHGTAARQPRAADPPR
jgi:outer membrane protein assembly factor BamB